MSRTRVRFDSVSKAFARGERHDSLRDLIPATIRALRGRRRAEPADLFWALRDVSFEVQAGHALGIIGRNGAGKSTVLKLLTRILRPTHGTCAVIGRTGALIEVAAGFHPDLTGRENIYHQGAIMGMKRAEIATRFDEIVAFAGIESFIDTPVKRYSSGMNARLGFSIAAHLTPDVLLIDEVLAVGDKGFQEKCQARMQQFLREGVAIVFVSHHLPAVAQLCDEVLLLEQGQPKMLGKPADVISAYCRTTGSSDQDDVAIQTVFRSDRHAGPADSFEIAPGQRLTLDVTLDFRVDIGQATVGIVIWDLARELYVYGASSDFVGIPLVSARAGERRTFTFSFHTHLSRGLYAIEVNVVDLDRHRFAALARGIRHFQVVERVTYDGIANLYLEGRDTTEESEAAALARSASA
ncbi:MAG TPA: ABC transporter ATP-binding protein [Vicinamibacterales bacterium]|nr:ABC transporter ATP-binding protein [Vicinamibacterales bacterium]